MGQNGLGGKSPYLERKKKCEKFNAIFEICYLYTPFLKIYEKFLLFSKIVNLLFNHSSC